ncbi:keratin, type I cytoskeletal 9-like [Hydractinia symbiolongicarpus]|uniref:keratin, type I cytoskeletal 9-like n=1 Tax=Hydractinia symbiolongicarpus TaxID=13093 RepID=UPI00254AF9A9|nr:keratin, type I cytoskeletal 9-like [Hydractinia symbiolongicarpus]
MKSSTLYVTGLEQSITEQTLKKDFEKYCKVERVTVICDKQTRLSKGFAYVLCESPEDATLGMKEMDGRIMADKPIKVKYSFSETPEWVSVLESRGTLTSTRSRGRGVGTGRGQYNQREMNGNSYGRGRGNSHGRGRGDSHGRGRGDSHGRGRGDSHGRGRGDSYGRGHSESHGRGRSESHERGRGNIFNRGRNNLYGAGRDSTFDSYGEGSGYANGRGRGGSYGRGHGDSYGRGHVDSYGRGGGDSFGRGGDDSYGTARGNSYGRDREDTYGKSQENSFGVGQADSGEKGGRDSYGRDYGDSYRRGPGNPNTGRQDDLYRIGRNSVFSEYPGEADKGDSSMLQRRTIPRDSYDSNIPPAGERRKRPHIDAFDPPSLMLQRVERDSELINRFNGKLPRIDDERYATDRISERYPTRSAINSVDYDLPGRGVGSVDVLRRPEEFRQERPTTQGYRLDDSFSAGPREEAMYAKRNTLSEYTREEYNNAPNGRERMLPARAQGYEDAPPQRYNESGGRGGIARAQQPTIDRGYMSANRFDGNSCPREQSRYVPF